MVNGAYAINEDPYFDPKSIAWLERGGLIAFAHVRGGGEYGEEWHQAAMMKNKANTWKDFIACGEYLVGKGYTSPARLAGRAGSAGGILIGRAITDRPDLFAAALDDVGLSDMIRDMFSGDGPLNVTEYGGLDTADGFHNLLEISAYYKVKDQVKYPAVLLTTGINDPRVVPWEPAKMAARLQAATASGRPILLRVDYQGGHGGIGGTSEQLREMAADAWSFLLWQFGDPTFQPDAQQSGSSIEVPTGARTILTAKGEGVQIYSCVSAQDGAKWTLKGPDAKLLDATGEQIGTHYAGPTWELKDGSKVAGQMIASQPSPDAASIPWLLLRAKLGSRTATLANVTFIRRTDTHGGVPLAADCQKADDVGKATWTPYSATYTFYTDQH
jgi:hypothetical protein